MKKTPPAILVILGVVALMNVVRNPRFEVFHTVDVLSLIASGLCFGVALALILRGLGIGRSI
jgi:membrane associated rhomboid family serine protease